MLYYYRNSVKLPSSFSPKSWGSIVCLKRTCIGLFLELCFGLRQTDAPSCPADNVDVAWGKGGGGHCMLAGRRNSSYPPRPLGCQIGFWRCKLRRLLERWAKAKKRPKHQTNAFFLKTTIEHSSLCLKEYFFYIKNTICDHWPPKGEVTI